MQVDNTAAFDRVEWDFLQEVMEAMGFPEEFRDFIKEVYTDLQFAIRVNGRTGRDRGVSNGVRQGCPASPLIFLIVQEALLIAIRGDALLRGIEVGVGRGKCLEVRERCMADDTVVYLRSAGDAVRLFEIIKTFEIASGQKLNPSKSTGVLFGAEKRGGVPKGMRIEWMCFGDGMIEEGLGVRVGTEGQVLAQWEEEAAGMVEAMRGQMTQSKHAMSTTARVRCIQGAFVSKLMYPWQVQAPKDADRIISEVQKQMDAALFEGRAGGRGWFFIERSLAVQPLGDGGLGQISLRRRLEAMWASLAISLGGREEVWKGVWAAELEKVYGGLDGRALVGTTCGFRKFARDGEGLEVMRRGLEALAALPVPKGGVIVPVKRAEVLVRQVEAEERRDAGGSREEVSRWEPGEIGDKKWQPEEVEAQWLFFNPWYQAGTRLTGRSTLKLEEEAVKWSKVGLRTWGDLSRGGKLVTREQLHRAYGHLDGAVYEDLRAELHGEWKAALAKGNGAWLRGGREREGEVREVRAMCCWYDEGGGAGGFHCDKMMS